MSPWKVVAASVRGSSHELSGGPCQDAHAFLSREDWLIAVVCDGAGTARNGDHGARHAAETLVKFIGERVDTSGDIQDDELRAVVESGIEYARETVLASLNVPIATLSDCHATVVGCVATAKGLLFFHIGDGAAIGLKGTELASAGISAPENGEFANTTYFYTQDFWREHLRFTAFTEPVDLVVLMSDGAMGFCMSKGCTDAERRFLSPVTRYLADPAVDAKTGSEALMATLSSTGAASVSDDDKTLVWAFRSTSTGQAET